MLILKLLALFMAFRTMYEFGEHIGEKNGMKNQLKIMRKLLRP